MSKHTKGPWFYERDTWTVRHGERDGKLNPHSEEVDLTCPDNGSLVAAAPEMLKELRTVLNTLQCFNQQAKVEVFRDRFEQRLAAMIAKAEGREQGGKK